MSVFLFRESDYTDASLFWYNLTVTGADGCGGLVGGHLWYVGEEGVEVLREGRAPVPKFPTA
jgi:hypothetical protein